MHMGFYWKWKETMKSEEFNVCLHNNNDDVQKSNENIKNIHNSRKIKTKNINIEHKTVEEKEDKRWFWIKEEIKRMKISIFKGHNNTHSN